MPWSYRPWTYCRPNCFHCQVSIRTLRLAHLDEQVREKILKIPTVKAAMPISPEQVQKRFGDRIREIRRRKGISQEDLALACDIDRAYLGAVERGQRNISLLNIYKIARGLKVPARELMP